MKAKIGIYEIDHPGFESLDDAVKFVKSNYPELDDALIKKNVKSLVNGKSKSQEVTVGGKESQTGNSKDRKTVVGAKPSGENQH